jgi:transcription elongation factor S-II
LLAKPAVPADAPTITKATPAPTISKTEPSVTPSSIEEAKQSKAPLLPQGKTIQTGNKVRDNLRKTLVDTLQAPPNNSGEVYDEPTLVLAAELALEIEEEMYAHLKDSKAYGDKARSIIFNLRDPKNPKLKSRIINGFLTPKEVVTGDTRLLASDEEQKKLERMLEEKLAERRTDY